MNDASTIDQTSSEPAQAPVPAQSLRPATPADLKLVHARLMEIIDTTPFYGEEFRAYEKARLSPVYLRNLISIDPRHVLMMQKDGAIIGFMLSGPELGTLWLYWTYIFPDFQGRSRAMSYLRLLVEAWDNDRFHKVATYTRPDNRVAIALMKRMHFTHTVTLEKHMFGEDYMLFEHKLTKAIPGYDNGVAVSRWTRWKNALLVRIGR